jgi:hypothetical protein
MVTLPRWEHGVQFLGKIHSRDGEVMHGLYEALLSACDNYQVMQQVHLHCLATEAQPDIARLVFERDHLFADLQNHLTAVVYQIQKAVLEPSLVPILQARLTAVLEEDAVLVKRLYAYRATLEQRRAQIRYGQKVLGGYGSPVPTRAPMVIDRAG